ncbi:MAG: hypothetical protein CMJ85_08330 [Planctomycetes bacterium]|nr:hypothetical protein [Planctomycetota bacterium]
MLQLPRRTTLLLVSSLLLAGCTVHKGSFVATRDDGSNGRMIEIAYDGVESISRIILSRRIEDLMLDLSKESERQGAAFDAALEIEDQYRSEGYADAQVEYEVKPVADESKPLLVLFRVKEGPLVMVEKLELSGNNTIPAAELMPLWDRRFSGALGLGDPIYVEGGIAAFRDAIRALYQSRGHLVADAGSLHVDRVAPGRVHVKIQIREGALFKLRKATLSDALNKALGAKTPQAPIGKAFSLRAIEDWRLAVRWVLRELGHPDPALEMTIAGDKKNALVDVQLLGDPGRPQRVSEVVVRGNEQTLHSVIRDKLDLGEGDLYSGKAEDEALRRLYLTGLFRKVRILHEPVESKLDTIRIVIEVEEVETKSVSIELGFGTYERYRGGLRLEERNVLGTGRDFMAEGKLHTKGYLTRTTLTDPDVLGTRTSFTIGGEYFRREEPSFVDQALGATASLQRRIFGPLTGRIGYSFELRSGASVQALDPTRFDPDYDQGFVFTELGIDTRDSPLFTTSGHREVLSLDIADDSLGGEVSYLRLRARSTVFIPVSDRVRIVLRGDVGWIWANSNSTGLPLPERFYNGGENTVRSFKESLLGPRDSKGDPLGGEFRNLFNVEARFSLWHPLEGVLFIDAGNVGSRVQDYGLDDMRFGVGAGLSYGLPIGPIRFDAAYNPDRRSREDEWVLHLTIGHPF